MFRLALALGRTVGELEESMSYAELRQWVQFFEIHPWGNEVEWLRFGVIAATVINQNPHRKKGAKRASPADFVPKRKRRTAKKPASSKEQKTANARAVMADLINAFGNRVKNAPTGMEDDADKEKS